MSNTFRQVVGSIGTALVVNIYTNVANNGIKLGTAEDGEAMGVLAKGGVSAIIELLMLLL